MKDLIILKERPASRPTSRDNVIMTIGNATRRDDVRLDSLIWNTNSADVLRFYVLPTQHSRGFLILILMTD